MSRTSIIALEGYAQNILETAAKPSHAFNFFIPIFKYYQTNTTEFFGLNTEIDFIKLCFQSEHRKIRTEKASYETQKKLRLLGHFGGSLFSVNCFTDSQTKKITGIYGEIFLILHEANMQ